MPRNAKACYCGPKIPLGHKTLRFIGNRHFQPSFQYFSYDAVLSDYSVLLAEIV